jgi:hypothetical protein
MKKLEEFVSSHKDEFDSKLPSPDLWNKIEAELEGRKNKTIGFWKIASAVAAVLVVALLSTFFINTHSNNIQRYANISDPVLIDLLETEAYYAKKVSSYMKEINKCYAIYPELKNDIESDLNELDYMYKELRNDLNDNFYNREVIEAMIQNNKTKLEMVDRVLSQINC